MIAPPHLVFAELGDRAVARLQPDGRLPRLLLRSGL